LLGRGQPVRCDPSTEGAPCSNRGEARTQRGTPKLKLDHALQGHAVALPFWKFFWQADEDRLTGVM